MLHPFMNGYMQIEQFAPGSHITMNKNDNKWILYNMISQYYEYNAILMQKIVNVLIIQDVI